MVLEADQVTPMHFHWLKTEDIINRGGGRLALQLYNATANEALADSEVQVSVDGQMRALPAGGIPELAPGESVTLPDHVYHAFWGVGSRVLVGEVSLVNDDHTDNRFLEPVGRFPAIEEDEPPLRLLVGDYDRLAGA
jgi:D-lyxose ketol-isomerase